MSADAVRVLVGVGIEPEFAEWFVKAPPQHVAEKVVELLDNGVLSDDPSARLMVWTLAEYVREDAT